MSPYPLDAPSMTVSMMTRVMAPVLDQPEAVAKAEYYRARRNPLTWQISG